MKLLKKIKSYIFEDNIEIDRNENNIEINRTETIDRNNKELKEILMDLSEIESIVNNSSVKLVVLNNNEENYNLIKIKSNRVAFKEVDKNIVIENKGKGKGITINAKREEKIIIYTDLSKLKKIELKNIGDMYVESMSEEDNEINMSSIGDLTLNKINSEKLKINKSGTSDLYVVEGYVEDIYINSSGVGELNLKNVIVNFAELNINSVGDTKINVVENITGCLRGVGDLKLYKNPSLLDIEKKGIGSIIKY